MPGSTSAFTRLGQGAIFSVSKIRKILVRTLSCTLANSPKSGCICRPASPLPPAIRDSYNRRSPQLENADRLSSSLYYSQSPSPVARWDRRIRRTVALAENPPGSLVHCLLLGPFFPAHLECRCQAQVMFRRVVCHGFRQAGMFQHPAGYIKLFQVSLDGEPWSQNSRRTPPDAALVAGPLTVPPAQIYIFVRSSSPAWAPACAASLAFVPLQHPQAAVF